MSKSIVPDSSNLTGNALPESQGMQNRTLGEPKGMLEMYSCMRVCIQLYPFLTCSLKGTPFQGLDTVQYLYTHVQIVQCTVYDCT